MRECGGGRETQNARKPESSIGWLVRSLLIIDPSSVSVGEHVSVLIVVQASGLAS